MVLTSLKITLFFSLAVAPILCSKNAFKLAFKKSEYFYCLVKSHFLSMKAK